MSHRRIAILGALLVAVLTAACTGPSPQTFEGALGSGWDAPPIAIRALAGSDVVQAAVQSDGTFQIRVPGQRHYRFELVRADGSAVPVVFERGGGMATERLRVWGGTTTFQLGLVNRVAPYQSRAVISAVDGTARDPDTWSMTSQALTIADGSGGTPRGGAAGDDDGDEVEVCDAAFDSDGDSDDDDFEGEHEDADDGAGVDDEFEGEHEDADGADDEEEGTELALAEAAVADSAPPSGIGVCDDSDSDSEDDGNDTDDVEEEVEE